MVLRDNQHCTAAHQVANNDVVSVIHVLLACRDGRARLRARVWPEGKTLKSLPPSWPSPAQAGRWAASAAVLRHARDEGGW